MTSTPLKTCDASPNFYESVTLLRIWPDLVGGDVVEARGHDVAAATGQARIARRRDAERVVVVVGDQRVVLHREPANERR